MWIVLVFVKALQTAESGKENILRASLESRILAFMKINKIKAKESKEASHQVL